MHDNMVEENVMYQQLQKICRGKVCTKEFFGQNILRTPKKLPAPAPMMAKPVCLRCYKFLHAAKIHRKFCSPRLYTKQCTGRKAEF